MSTLQDLNKVLSRKQAILDENAAGVEQQKKSGKQTARERIAMLLDGGSFVEQSMLAQDARRRGRKRHCGRPPGVCLCAGFCRDGRRDGREAGEEDRQDS